MGGATMYCVLCGYPADSRYARGNPYVEDTSHLNNIVVLLKDGSFTAVGSTDSDDGFGLVKFPGGTYISTIDFVEEGTDRGFMMHEECSLILREMMGSNGVSVYNWLCDNVEDCYNNTIDGYSYDEYKCNSRREQFWFDIFPRYDYDDDDEDDENDYEIEEEDEDDQIEIDEDYEEKDDYNDYEEEGDDDVEVDDDNEVEVDDDADEDGEEDGEEDEMEIDDDDTEEDDDDDDEHKTVNLAVLYASPNINGFVYNQSVINTVSDTEQSVLNLIFDLMMFDMFIDYKDAIALAGTSKLMRGQIARDNRYWKRVHNYRKFKFDEDLNFDQMVQKLHSPNVMKRSRLQYTVQYILDRCTA
ncbi:hypothetical protein GQ42DRAFT_160072 [Ramicandelaber brevisporus]|nr:hypothetical protein GQ42DRAFT_160072 [Ramicandelaber brevisporus]